MSQIRPLQMADRPTARCHSLSGSHKSALACVVLGVACASAREPTASAPTEDARSSSTPPSASAEQRASVASEPEGRPDSAPGAGLRVLSIEGFEPAVVVVPATPRPLPLLVAAHGAGGDPAWECERWARAARGRFFLLCPRGVALRRGEEGSYFYPDHLALEREVTAAVAAARREFGARLAARDGVYIGYSQGATMGALMLVEHGAEFPHLLLIEGGSSDWTLARATRFRATGGQSVFIVCGTPPCAQRATRAVPVLERAGLRAEARAVQDGGHTELGPVGDAAEILLDALVQHE